MRTFVFAIICIALCLGALEREKPNPAAAKDKCIWSGNPLLELKRVETKLLGTPCIAVTCDGDGSVIIERCAVMDLPEGACFLKNKNPNPVYPMCCFQEPRCT